MGACNIGTRSPNRSEKRVARARALRLGELEMVRLAVDMAIRTPDQKQCRLKISGATQRRRFRHSAPRVFDG